MLFCSQINRLDYFALRKSSERRGRRRGIFCLWSQRESPEHGML